jgi:hypothetical protein
MSLTPNDQEYWDCKEIFKNQLLEMVKLFEVELSKQYKSATVRQYTNIASAWAEYLHDYPTYLKYEDILVGDANSRFTARAESEYGIDEDGPRIRQRLKAFIEFLDENGFSNEKVFKSLR